MAYKDLKKSIVNLLTEKINVLDEGIIIYDEQINGGDVSSVVSSYFSKNHDLKHQMLLKGAIDEVWKTNFDSAKYRITLLEEDSDNNFKRTYGPTDLTSAYMTAVNECEKLNSDYLVGEFNLSIDLETKFGYIDITKLVS